MPVDSTADKTYRRTLLVKIRLSPEEAAGSEYGSISAGHLSWDCSFSAGAADRTFQQTHAVLSMPSLKEFSASAEEDTGYQNHAVCITPSLEQVCASTEAVLSIRVHQNHIHPLPDVAFC